MFALILLLVGAVAVALFAEQASDQQDELLEQRASGDADFVAGPLLHDYQEGETPGGRRPVRRSLPVGHGPGDRLYRRVATRRGRRRWQGRDDLGLDLLGPLLRAPFRGAGGGGCAKGETVYTTEDGPEGEVVRVASVPVAGNEGGLAVVQAAQSRRVVWEEVGGLFLILVPVGLVGLLLSGAGGLYMSRRAMQPVKDSFQRQRTFIADASHELKTPLALATINAEVVKCNPTDPENR